MNLEQTKVRIRQIGAFYAQRRIAWKDIPRNCGFGREFWGLLENTVWPEPELNNNSKICVLEGAPVPYELEFRMSNAGDCQDWLTANNKKVEEFI